MVNIYGFGSAFNLKYQSTPLKFNQRQNDSIFFQRRQPMFEPRQSYTPSVPISRGFSFLKDLLPFLAGMLLGGILKSGAPKQAAPEQKTVATPTVETKQEPKKAKEEEPVVPKKEPPKEESKVEPEIEEKKDDGSQGKLDLDVDGQDGEETSTKVQIVARKTGNYFLSHAYVDADGNNLTVAEYREIQNYFRQNEVGFEDGDGNGSLNTTKDFVILPNQITVGGKTYYLAKNARQKIIDTRGGTVPSADRTYNAGTVGKTDGEYYVVNKNKKAGEDGYRVDDKTYKTRAEAEAAKNDMLGDS